MADVKRYIAFDLGAESGRCVVGELKNDKLDLHEVHRFPTHTVTYNRDLFWDILVVFEEMKIGLSRAGQKFGSHFDGISVDTWGVDYVLLDRDGWLLGYPHHYRSCRLDGMMEKAFRVVPREEIYSRTGIQFMQINTLYQLLAEKEQQLNMLGVADHFLLMPDFFHYLLSGTKKAEYTIVSTTQLSDPRRRNWSWELIKDFGLPEKIFPEVVEPGTLLGHLLPELAEKTGLDPETPVIAGASHDTAAAVASVPASQGSWAYLSSGTWSLMGVELESPLINQQSLKRNFTNEGGVLGTTRFLKNIMGFWILQECRRAWEKDGSVYDYSTLARLASQERPTEAWIDPNDKRFLQPGDMPGKIISFLKETNQNCRDETGWITRCILESLAFKYRLTFKELEELTGKRINRLHAVGGGIRNELLCQMTADAIDREVIAGPIEGTVVGNIGVQAIAMGQLAGLEALRNVVHKSSDLKSYQPKQAAYWEKHEEFFRSLLEG
ncbi:MAG: rhamnulokinase family protein [Bacteroidota bacterium]